MFGIARWRGREFDGLVRWPVLAHANGVGCRRVDGNKVLKGNHLEGWSGVEVEHEEARYRSVITSWVRGELCLRRCDRNNGVGQVCSNAVGNIGHGLFSNKVMDLPSRLAPIDAALGTKA